jgi:hypothetical protein
MVEKDFHISEKYNFRHALSEDRHFTVLRKVQFPKVDVIGIQAFQREMLKGD